MQSISNIEIRIEKLRNLMKEKEADSVLVSKKENVVYLSGFTGSDALLFITKAKKFLVTDFRYLIQASQECGQYEVRKYKDSIEDEIKSLVFENDVSNVGIEEKDLTHFRYNKITDKIPNTGIIYFGEILETLRIIKDDKELKNIRKSVEITDDVFKEVLKYIKPGVTENEIASEIQYHIRKKGGTGQSFEIIVASGLRSALPHGVASDKKINNNEPVVIDFGSIYNDYCSDMTRTVFVGEPTEELKKIYNVVLKAQKNAIDYIKEGIVCKEADSIARDYIAKNGYGDYFGHALGHGVGLEIHENPRLSTKCDIVLKSGMTVTVEPGIYIENIGGVRIEDLVVIKDNKADVMSSSSKDIIIL